MLINSQAIRKGCDEFQRVKLRLIGKSNRPRSWNRDWDIACKLCRKPQLLCGLHLSLQFLLVLRKDIAVPTLEIAGNPFFCNQLVVLLNGLQVGLGICPRHLHPLLGDEIGVNKPMLGRYLGRGILRLSACYAVSFQDYHLFSRLLKQIGC